MNKIKREAVTSIEVTEQLHQEFKQYVRARGFAINKATEMALRRWMATGCNEDMLEFLNKKV